MTIDEALEQYEVLFTRINKTTIRCRILYDVGAIHKDREAVGDGKTADEAFHAAVRNGQAQEWIK